MWKVYRTDQKRHNKEKKMRSSWELNFSNEVWNEKFQRRSVALAPLMAAALAVSPEETEQPSANSTNSLQHASPRRSNTHQIAAAPIHHLSSLPPLFQNLWNRLTNSYSIVFTQVQSVNLNLSTSCYPQISNKANNSTSFNLK